MEIVSHNIINLPLIAPLFYLHWLKAQLSPEQA